MKIAEILRECNSIKKKGMPFYTNYYNQCKDMQDDDFFTISAERALAFLWDDMGVKRIYFFASDLKELKEILSRIDKGSVIDFITREKDALRDIFEAAGYNLYMEYGRFYQERGHVNAKAAELQRAIYDDKCKEEYAGNKACCEAALESDVEEIDSHLRRLFDPYEAHFYSLEKLRENISKGWVWLFRENGKIIAGNLFEVQGNKGYSSYMWNNGDTNVISFLNYKMGEYFNSLNIKYFYCWMRLNNRRIIRYNMKFLGFMPDGLYDMIYVKR